MAEPLILTNVGLAKLASATPEDQLKIASVAVGDGNGGYPPLNPAMTALTNEVWRGIASEPIRDDDNGAVLIFETIIPADDGGFFIRELGLFDDTGAMIAIGQTGVVEKPAGGSGTPLTMTVRVRLALANAAQTSLIINDTPYIDHQGTSNRDAANAHPMTSITGLVAALAAKQDTEPTQLYEFTDLDYLLKSDRYQIILPENIANLPPDAQHGTVDVYSYDGSAYQVFTSIPSELNRCDIFIRSKPIGFGAWSPWFSIYHTGNFTPSDYVAKAGNVTITGVKTFSASPIVPTPSSANQAANKGYVDSLLSYQPVISGSATLTGADNKIVMTGIVSGLGLEVGDVIQISYAGYDKLHTVESITDNSSIIVNYEHAGNRGDGPLKLPDFTGQATVTRIAKWFNAPIGLGQEWVVPARASNTTYLSPSNRSISVNISPRSNSTTLTVGGVNVATDDYADNQHSTINAIVQGSTPYMCAITDGLILNWRELR